MLKTVSYNDFYQYSDTQTSDFSFMLEEFKTFHQNKGDLNLPVYNNERKIVTFEQWMRERYPNNPEYFKQLIDENLINNPFNFIVNHEDKTIYDIENFGLYWFVSHYDYYKPYIVEAIGKLAYEIKDWNISIRPKRSKVPLGQIEEASSNEDIVYPSYFHLDYNQKYNNLKYLHPFHVITERLINGANFETILEKSPKYSNLWDEAAADNMLVAGYGGLKNLDIAYVFYKYDVACSFFDKEPSYLASLIIHSIRKDDLSLLKKISQRCSLKLIEKESDGDFFLSHCQSKEMTLFLLEQGTFIENSLISECYKSCLTSRIHMNALSIIMEASPLLQKKVIDDPDYFYNLFLRDQFSLNSWENLKLLVEKFSFPLEKYDMLFAANKFFNVEPKAIEWVIKSGADPRMCSSFINDMVDKRGGGLKNLKLLQKDNIFSSYTPDSIFWILFCDPTKDFTTWLSKAPTENFKRFTKEGYPAWWSVHNLSGQSLILEKKCDIRQLSSQGLSLFFYISKHYKNISYDNEFNYNTLITRFNKENKINAHFDITGVDKQKKNLYHYFFGEAASIDKKLSKELIITMLSNTPSDIGYLLSQKDINENTPLEYILSINDDSKSYRIKEASKLILQHYCESLNFDDTIIYKGQNIPVFDAIKILMDNENFPAMDTIIKCHDSYLLYKSIDKSLHREIDTTKKMKI